MTLDNLGLILLALLGLKGIIIGSEFSFNLWIKHGVMYLHYYNNRPTFEQWFEETGKHLTPVSEDE